MIDSLLNVLTAIFIAYFLACNPQIITSLPSDIILMVSDIATELTSMGEDDENR